MLAWTKRDSQIHSALLSFDFCYRLAAEVNTGVPAAHEVQGHRIQQQNLLWERHPPDVCGLCRQLYQGLCSHGHCGRADPGPRLAEKVAGHTGPPRGGGLAAGGHRPTGWQVLPLARKRSADQGPYFSNISESLLEIKVCLGCKRIYLRTGLFFFSVLIANKII